MMAYPVLWEDSAIYEPIRASGMGVFMIWEKGLRVRSRVSEHE
jgi:hypothetical protein